jgi:four helix bundle protein
MATFKTFEEIEAWQRGRALANRIYQLSQEGSFAKDYKLKDQINGSSGSIMDNIAEGFERNGSREFIQFLAIAKGSAGEVRSQLYRAFDRRHFSEQTFKELMDEVTVIGKLISGLIHYLNQSDLKGAKFVREPEEPYPNFDSET